MNPPSDPALSGALFEDAEIAALLSEEAAAAAMLRVEAALARATAETGLIPAAAAEKIATVAAGLQPDPAMLRAGTAADGVPVPALVTALRAATGDEAAPYVHFGATSQDIVDTGLVLRLGPVCDLLDARLAGLCEALARHAEAERDTVMAGRTRGRMATPVTFGLKIAGWLAPLVRHRQRLLELRPRLLCLQCGGAAGTLAAWGEAALPTMTALGAALELPTPPMPWQAQRDGIAEFAGWLSLVSGSLGKMGGDLVLLGQSETGEVRAGDGGGSSTMPHKANPVRAEAMVSLARLNAGLLSSLHQALLHDQERDGAAWAMEWLTLPRMITGTGAALGHATTLAATLAADPARMRANLEATNGLVLAEAAVFALAATGSRSDAEETVRAACATARQSGRHLMDVLSETAGDGVDWSALRDPAGYTGAANAFVDRVLAAAREGRTR